MAGYELPLRDVRHTLEHVTPLSELLALPDFAHVDADVVAGLLAEAGRFASEVVAPTDRDGDREGARLVDGRVRLPASFVSAYRAYVEAGWGTVQHPAELGGGGFPLTLATVVKEALTSANLAFSLGPLLTTGAVHLLTHHASPEQRERYLPRMVTGEWMGTMNLTEPQAGSDLGAVTCRAVPAGDGTYRLTGQKIYITFGDHDLTEQVVHLVLARLPDAPAGTKGISLFIVPRHIVDADGGLGAENDVRVVSIEHKLGIHGSPTCVMAYGEAGDGAVAELVGDPNDGMRQMFTMMNDARLGVGVQGVAVAERAYQRALAYALERRQGRAPGAAPGEASPIVEHPDVRRMLLVQRSGVLAARALCLATAHALDLAAHHPEEGERERQRALADLLTPLAKSWSTDLGVELTSLALQVHGGMGYVEETGVAQHVRDARIAPIYEGTNGIQAIDLVLRKLPVDDGAMALGFLDGLDGELAAASADLGEVAEAVRRRLAAVRTLTTHLLERRGSAPVDVLAAATPYLRALATVVGGALLVRGALAAARRLAEGGLDAADAEHLAGWLAATRFFATQVVPTVDGLAPAVLAPADDLMAPSTAALSG